MSPIANTHSTRRERVGWYAYALADQPFVTTVMTVLGTIYLTRLAGIAAGCNPDQGGCADRQVPVLWFDIPIGSLWAYTTSVSVLFAVVMLPIVGTIADRSPNKRRLLVFFAVIGALFMFSFVFVGIDSGNYLFAAFLILGANIFYACASVVYDSYLPQLAGPADRDRVSSIGWAGGYISGGVFLMLNLLTLNLAEAQGINPLIAVQYGMAATGIWWIAWTMFTLSRLENRPLLESKFTDSGMVKGSLKELKQNFSELKRYPYTLLFLGAFLLYSDGISTVIALSSTYGDQELGLSTDVLVLTILIVQFVNFAGALTLKAIAVRIGAKKTILLGLIGWSGVVLAAFWMPAGSPGWFLALGVALGMVMGGTQALSRSLFSQLIPEGREAAYFGIYQIADRGTSWIGPLVFGVIVQMTGSMRAGIFALLAFFILGFILLAMVPIRKAIEAVGNTPPAKV
ncbi:MFS transporter [Natronoglycomyces albus]|uniref:MFS transporter n=1 Tax=Natronoglycomyces albus TaxID=2811108 RepID=A0A895XSZ1_9ACTN|nr:MFS transporter [Natronoglycomyces albus]QSB06772.1 MFS transporter [Natronoglycomyces albus]